MGRGGARTRRTQAERRATATSALLAAATELLIEGGVSALTLAAVGERAGYSRGMVSHHFGSKRGLLDQLTESMQEDFVPGLERRPAGLDRLLARVEGYVLALPAADRGWHAYVLLWAQASADPQLAAVFGRRDASFRGDIARDVVAGQATGEVRAELEPAAVAIGVVGQLRGIGLQWLVDREAIDLPALAPAVAAGWRRQLAAAP